MPTGSGPATRATKPSTAGRFGLVLPNKFDIVATSMVTHYIPDRERTLSEMVRVSRAGGYLIYTDYVFRSWLAKVGRRLIRFVGFPSTSALDSLAARAGLVKVHESQEPGKVDVITVPPNLNCRKFRL